MNSRNQTFRAAILLTVWIAGLILAAHPARSADERPDRYEVELILFRYLDQNRNTPEIPAASSLFNPSPLDLTLPELPAQGPEEDGNAAEMAPTDAHPLIISAGEQRVRTPTLDFLLLELEPEYPDFVPLRDSKYALNRIYRRLERIDAYEPLLHVGWIQPARSSADSIPFRFEPQNADGKNVTGTITLFKERFLHLDVDLALESDRRPAGAPFFFGWNEDRRNVHKLKESRRIRTVDIQYFDNPQFGLITRIREVRAAEAERDERG